MGITRPLSTDPAPTASGAGKNRRFRQVLAACAAGATLTLGSFLAPVTSIVAPAATSTPALADPQYSVTPDGLVLPATLRPLAAIPAWVQAIQTTRLYPDDRGGNAPLVVGRTTFLRVLGGGSSRLYVQVMDNNGKRTYTTGWVDPTSVTPTVAGENWLRNFRATSLFSTAASDAPKTLDLAQWSYVQATGLADNGRLPVRVYDGSFRTVSYGWVSQADLGPVGPPNVVIYSYQGTGMAVNPFPTQAAFLSAVGAAAKQAQAQTGVPAAVTVAQAILESNWGQSGLSRIANNYFGIKAMGSLGSDGAIWMPTLEYDSDGSAYTVTAPFRAYKSLADSVVDHDYLFVNLGLYASAMAARNDPQEFARQIQQDGYATDPSYADKLISLMDQYNLYQYD